MKKKCIVTNNPMVREKFEQSYEILYIDGNYSEVLNKVKNLIHEGYLLLTHPLSSSIKPNETPYKSIMVEQGNKLDFQSLELIENSIETTKKFRADFDTPMWSEKIRGDFKMIDLSIIENAMTHIQDN